MQRERSALLVIGAALSLVGALLTRDVPSIALSVVATLLALAGVLQLLFLWFRPSDPWVDERRWRRRARGPWS